MRSLSTDWVSKLIAYVDACSTGKPGEYRFSTAGEVTLSASCFAAMIFHYLGHLESLGQERRDQWIDYLKSHQQNDTGLFVGPEIRHGEFRSSAHTPEHLSMHLTAHVLPALDVLAGRPKSPLFFAHRFLDGDALRDWLRKRDWHLAWLEGNNLLFVGQFLTYLLDQENKPQAKRALEYLFEWLDSQQDPATGLWGTDGYCDKHTAVYGGYHQLLLYYYWHRELKHRERLVDTVLSLQQGDGGFAPTRGGGTCENVDAVDILVNMCKQTDYRRAEVLLALRKAFWNVLSKQTPEGGFVYKWGVPFEHMGMSRTRTPANVANMFSTWFSVHTVLLIGEVLPVVALPEPSRRFNRSCSMGWHRPYPVSFWRRLGASGRARQKLQIAAWSLKELVIRPCLVLRTWASHVAKDAGGRMLKVWLRRVPRDTRPSFVLKLLLPFLNSLSVHEQMFFLAQMETGINECLKRKGEVSAANTLSRAKSSNPDRGTPQAIQDASRVPRELT